MITRQDINSLKPIVRFTKGIEDIEGYLEAGMLARITRVTEPDSDGVFLVFYDLSEFDEVNRQFEKADYYDGDMVPCMTARELGYYKPQDDYYTEATDCDGTPYWLTQFEIVPTTDGKVKLMEMYRNRTVGPQLSYVEWLEIQCVAAMTLNDSLAETVRELNDYKTYQGNG